MAGNFPYPGKEINIQVQEAESPKDTTNNFFFLITGQYPWIT